MAAVGTPFEEEPRNMLALISASKFSMLFCFDFLFFRDCYSQTAIVLLILAADHSSRSVANPLSFYAHILQPPRIKKVAPTGVGNHPKPDLSYFTSLPRFFFFLFGSAQKRHRFLPRRLTEPFLGSGVNRGGGPHPRAGSIPLTEHVVRFFRSHISKEGLFCD